MSIMKRALSAFLALVMVFSMVPTAAFAVEEEASQETAAYAEAPVSEETEAVQTEAAQTEPAQNEPEQNEPEQTEPEQTEPEQTEPEQTEPEQTEPEQTEPEQTEPEQTEPEQTEPEQTEPQETEPQETEPEETEPQETEPEETEPQETEPEETEPEEEWERIPLIPEVNDWDLKEKTYTHSETITVVEEVEPGVFSASEKTQESSITMLEAEVVYNYSAEAMGAAASAPTTFETFDELKQILRSHTGGNLVLTYQGDGVLLIRENLTIPRNVTLLTDNTPDPWTYAEYTYEGNGTENITVEVPAGVELTVNGSLQVAGLKLWGNLNVNGFVKVHRGICIPFQCGAILRLNSQNLYLDPDCRYDVDMTNKIDVNNDGSDIYYWHDTVSTKDAFIATMDEINSHSGHFAHRVLVDTAEPILLDEDVTIGDNVLMSIRGDYGVTVAEGCTLTINSERTVDLRAPMQINGILENNGRNVFVNAVYTNKKIVFSDTGSYIGSGDLYISKGNAAAWDDIVVGLDPEVYYVDDTYNPYCWKLINVEGRTQLPAPRNLTWHKRAINGEVTNLMGSYYWEVDTPDSLNYLIRLHDAATDNEVWRIEYGVGRGDGTNRRSLPYFLFENMPSGSYYFTVAMIPQPQWQEDPIYTDDLYYASRTVKSPVWKYTKPGKTLGVPTNLTTSWPMVTWNTPANGTKDTMYQVAYYFTPSEDEPPCQVGWNDLFTGNYNQVWKGLTEENGAGWYSFQVKALSEDVTKKCTGGWSDLSEPFYYDPENTTVDESFFQTNVDLQTGSILVDRNLVLKGDYTIPESTFLNIFDGGSVTVPAGVTLTVSGGVYLSEGSLTVMPGGTLNLMSTAMVQYGGELNIVDAESEDGGRIHFGEYGWVEQLYRNGEFVNCSINGVPDERRSLYMEIDAQADDYQIESTLSLLKDHQENGFARAYLSAQTSLQLPEEFRIPETALMWLENYSGESITLTVPQDGVLTIDGELYVNWNGTVVNEGTIHVNRALQLYGRLYNRGNIHLKTPMGADLEAILNVYAGAQVNNAGSVKKHYGAFIYQEKGSTWTGNAAEDPFTMFKKDVAAAQQGEGWVKVEDTIVLAENYTLPESVTMILSGGTIIVPSGKTLTLNGWTNLEGGTLIVEEGGSLKVNRDIAITGEDTIQVDGSVSFGDDAFIYCTYDHDARAVVPYTITGVSQNIGMRIYLDEAWDQDVVNSALDAFEHADSELYERAVLVVRTDLRLQRDICIPEIGIMHVDAGSELVLDSGTNVWNYGSFYVWPGNTLVNWGTIYNYCQLGILGELENYGSIILREDLYDEVTQIGNMFVEGGATVYNDGDVDVYPNYEWWCGGDWYGNAPRNFGGYIGGPGTRNDAPIEMSQAALLAAMKKVPSGYSYDLNSVVHLTGKSVTFDRQLNITDGAALYVPSGTTLNVNAGMYILEGGSVIVEPGAKIIHGGMGSPIIVKSTESRGGIFVMDEGAVYTQNDGASMWVMHNGEDGQANIWGVPDSQQTVYMENPSYEELRDAMDMAMEDYAGAWITTDNLYVPSGEYLTIPWNATLIIDPTWEDMERYANGEEMCDWVVNEGYLEVYGQIWVDAQWYYVTGDSVPGNFENRGEIWISDGGCLTAGGNVKNDGTIRLGVAGWLQTWEDFGRTWEGYAPEFVGGASNYWYDAGYEPWAMSQEEFQALLNNKNVSEIYLDRQVLLTRSITLTKPVFVGEGGGLIVDNGATMTVNTLLSIENGGDLVVYGSSKLVNNGRIEVDTFEYENGIVCLYGSFSGNMLSVDLEKNQPDIWPDDKSIQEGYYWSNGEGTTIKTALEWDLKEYGSINIHLTEDETLSGGETLIIPANFNITLAPGVSLTLDQDVELYGRIYLDKLTANSAVTSKLYNNARLTIKGDGCLDSVGEVYNNGTVYRHYSGYILNNGKWHGAVAEDAGTMSYQTLTADLKYYEDMQMITGDSEWFDYTLDKAVKLEGNLTAYSPIIHLVENGQIIVPKGKTLTVQGLYVEGGRITVQSGGNLVVRGRLSIMDSPNGINGVVTIEKGATLSNTGNITIGGQVLNEDETDYVALDGGTLACYGTYKPSGIHYLFRDDAIFDDYFEPRFTGSVVGIPTKYQVLPNINIDTGDWDENSNLLAYVIDNLHDWMGYMGAQIYVSECGIYGDMTIPDRFEVSVGTLVIEENKTLTVNGIFSAEQIENYGVLILGKNAETRLAGGSISGNAPVFQGAYIGPETRGIAVGAVDSEITLVNGSKITIDGSDAACLDEEGKSIVKLDIDVLPAVYGEWEDIAPLEYVTITSSNKKVLDPANIVRDEDGNYTLNNLGVGTTKLTITSMATLQGTAGRGGAFGKLIGKTVSTSVTVTVTPVKAAQVKLMERNPEYSEEDDTVEEYLSISSKVLRKSGDIQTFTVNTEILDTRGRIASGKQLIWSASDKKLATVKDNGDGTALITVQKNVDGLALITAQVKDQKEIAATLDLVIQDLTPRLGSTKFNVNPYLEAGTAIDLVESFGNRINSVAVDNPALKVSYDQENGKLAVTARDHNLKKQTIKNVMLHVFTDAGEYTFKLEIGIAPAYPKVTAKHEGKLDLFYTGSQQLLTVTAQNAVVTGVRLDGTADFALAENVLSFSEHLKQVYPNDTKYKLDNTADLYVTLEGYRGEVLVKNFKINTTTTKRTFQALSEVNGKLVNPAKLQRFLAKELLLGIYEKSGKLQILTPMESVVSTDQDVTITRREDGQVWVGCGDNVKSRKVTLMVMQEGWMRAQPVAFQYNIDNAKPTVKLTAGTISLNSILVPGSWTGFTTTLADRDTLEVSFGEFAAVKPNAETEKLDVRFDGIDICAEIVSDEAPRNGTYAFKATPYAVNVDGETVALNPVTVNVKVASDKPVLKLQKNTLTLNSNFNSEGDETAFTVTMVGPEAVEFDDFVAVKPNAETEKLWVSLEEGNIVAYIQDGEVPKNGTYAFRTTPYVYNVDGERVNLAPITVNVKVVNNKPKVKLKAATLTISRLFPQTAYVDTWLDSRTDLQLWSESGDEWIQFAPEAVKNQAQLEQAEKIAVYYNDGYIDAYVDQNDLPKAGTYKFSVYPTVTNGEDVVTLDKVTVNVTIEEKKVPTVKLKSNSVKLNTNLTGEYGEYVEIPATFTNKTGYADLYLDSFEIVNLYEDKVIVESFTNYDEGYTGVKVRLVEGAPKGNYKIDLYPLVRMDESDVCVKLGKITLTVSAYTAAVKVTTKATGKLDALNMDTGIRHSITKVDNAAALTSSLDHVTDVELYDEVLDNDLFRMEGLQRDAAGKPYFDLLLRDDVTYDLKKTYQVQVTYTVWDRPVNVIYKFKVTQTALKAAAVAPLNFYQSSGRPLTVDLSLASPAYACIDRIEFNKARSSKELAAALGFSGNADVYVSDEETWSKDASFGLEFVKLGNLKSGATYNLVLNVYPKHHAANAGPLQVTVKVKILK